MASTKEYLDYVSEQLGDVRELSYRAMMGEYILYVQGKVFGGIYDNRLLIKPTKSAREMLPDAPMELPYEGSKTMLLLVEELDDRAFLEQLIPAMASGWMRLFLFI